MSWTEVIMYAPGWAAIPLFILDKWLEARWARQDREAGR